MNEDTVNGKTYYNNIEDDNSDQKLWNQLKRRKWLSNPTNFVRITIFAASVGSFLFGYTIGGFNGAASTVLTEMAVCGPNLDFLSYDSSSGIAQFKGTPGYKQTSCSIFAFYLGLVQCLALVGGVIGSLIAGVIISKGRRKAMINTMVVFFVGYVLTIASTNLVSVCIGRFVSGIGVGLISVVAPTYISECSPKASRGRCGTLHQYMITFGFVIAVLFNFVYIFPEDYASDFVYPENMKILWRVAVGVGLIPALICFLFFTCILKFDTPIYYVENKKLADAKNLLSMIYNKDDVTEELNDVIDNVKACNDAKKDGLNLASIIKSPDYRLCLLVGIALACFQQFGGINALLTSSQDILKKAGVDARSRTYVSVAMTFLNLVATFPSFYLIEKIGRRKLLLIGSFLQFLALAPAAVMYGMLGESILGIKALRIVACTSIITFVIFFAVGFGPVLWVYLFEMFPIEMKDASTSLTASINWLSGVAMVFIANVISVQAMFLIFCGLQLIATIFIYFYMKETKGLPIGRSPYIRQICNNA